MYIIQKDVVMFHCFDKKYSKRKGKERNEWNIKKLVFNFRRR